jgi:hypothetical protein
VLILWQPVSLGLVGSSALNSLSVRGLPLALVLLGRIAVAAVGVAAGLALWRRALAPSRWRGRRFCCRPPPMSSSTARRIFRIIDRPAIRR